MKSLVIVESPTKAKTITKFLGKEYQIESSYGHVRDLPKSKMGVETEKGTFEPKYVIPTKSRKRVNELKKLAKNADEVLFATDEDREGEAISWHLAYLLDIPEKDTKRIVFHEITKSAIEKALENPRPIEMDLVNAQQARRILDRLVGYELSPLLWRKIYKGLSAGRVQSVTVRLIVERERERDAFKKEEYWTVEAKFKKDGQEEIFTAKLNKIDGKTLKKLDIKNKKQSDQIFKDLEKGEFKISDLNVTEKKRKPLAPFTTSTLQQAANNKLGFSAKQTMMFAQRLYETGRITYMRTDSFFMANKFLGEASEFIKAEYGADFAETRKYKSKQKGAQEAHEAIRPTNASETPASLKGKLEDKEYKLYDLIWRRAIASQMKDAILNMTSIDIEDQTKYSFRANGSQIKFEGWLKVFPEKVSENILPALDKEDNLNMEKLLPEQHFTEPPARYSEATIVKALEEKGIGRPSTYAPTISTVVARNYVEKEERKLKPTETGILVNDILVEHFPNIVDYEFTARMEGELDKIAEEGKEWQPLIADFYKPFKETIMQKDEELKKEDIAEQKTDEICDKCGKPMIIKMGRFGKFLACTGFPDCKNTKQLEDGEKKEEKKLDEKCPDCGKELVKKTGRFGPFTGCSGYPDCKYIKKEQKSTGIKCPKCGKGEIVTKRSRAGKTFYACDQYPDCENAYWSKPTGDKCAECESLLVAGAKDTVVCSNKECKNKK
ncbi:type I DNA topoisomerase [Patescibacteria group bacterium]|nr:type I DNA topoisomerase [Patescibacteria group bacterium]MBU1672979.1 type I DNA topoisomerase [Patescibacteria group bacterium]MBU1962986.1 type I DNA topoisomerase [Patescibacteria group bacterium]